LLIAPLVIVGRWMGLDQVLFDILAWIAYVDMVFFLVLVPLLVVRDTGWLLFRSLRTLHHKLSGRPPSITPASTARRRLHPSG